MINPKLQYHMLDEIKTLDRIMNWYDREIRKLEERREAVFERWIKLVKKVTELREKIRRSK